MIFISQIKAARALLGWRQEDLADRSGMSLTAINKLERELVSPRKATLEILQLTFEQAGIEFTEGPGVRLTDNIFNLQTFTGETAFRLLLDDIYNTLKETGGEVLLTGVDKEVWGTYTDKNFDENHQRRIKERNITWRAVLAEGNTFFMPGYEVKDVYRWIPETLFTQLLYYVYADKFAIVLPGHPLRVTVIQNKIVADTFRRQFEMNWSNGKVPPYGKK